MNTITNRQTIEEPCIMHNSRRSPSQASNLAPLTPFPAAFNPYTSPYIRKSPQSRLVVGARPLLAIRPDVV